MTDETSEVKHGIEQEGLDIFFYFVCPICGQKSRHAASGLNAGSDLVCPCGETTVNLTGDSLADLQRSLDDLKRSLDQLGNLNIDIKF